MRVFRDSTGLAVNPHLWGSIQTAMDESEWFILLTSPEAAASPWVNREIEHWKTARDPNRILPVLTDGEWHWDDATGDFDRDRSTALPDALVGVYEEEPRHLDLRWARKETQLDLRNSRFRDAMAELAAPIRGTTKDELEDDDIRLHRRAVRSAFAGVAVLAVALVAAVVGAALAVGNAHRAEDRERDAQARALSATSRSLLADQLDVALLLAVEANEIDASAESRGSLVAALDRTPQLERILQTDGPIEDLDSVVFSPDGTHLVAGGTYIDRTTGSTDEGPIFRWQLDGTGLEQWSVPGGTVVDVRATDDGIAYESIGDSAGVGLIGGEDVMLETKTFTTLSPDGTRGVLFRPDDTVELVDLRSGASVFRGDGVWQIGLENFSPDGRWAALPRGLGEAVVLDTETGEALGPIGVPGDEFEEVTFSANGEALAVAHDSGALTLSHVSRDELTPQALDRADLGPVLDVTLSGDGSRLAALGASGHLAVWDTASGTRLWDALRPPLGMVISPEQHAIALSNEGRTLLETGPVEASLRDASTGELVAAPQPTGTLTVKADGTRAAVTGETLSVWDLERGELIGTHPTGDGAATFSPDARFLVTYTTDLVLWDLARRELEPVPLDDGSESVTEVAFNADSTRLASVGDGTAARVWNVQGSIGLTTVLYPPNPVAYGRLAAIDPATDTTATFARYGAPVVVHRPEEDPVDFEVDDETYFLYSLDVADNRLVTRQSARRDETHNILWDVDSGDPIADPLACGSGDSYFLSSATMMTAERIVNVNRDEISVCDAEDGDESERYATPDIVRIPGEAGFSAALAPDGTRVAIGAPDGRVTLVDVESGDVVESFPFSEGESSSIDSIAFSPDGQDLVFATSFPGRVGVWTIGDSPDRVDVLEPDADRVTAVAISPDRNQIAVAGQATTVTDAPTEIELLTRDGEGAVGEPLPWPYPGSDIFELEYSADGTELFGTSINGGLVRWEVTDASWRDLACRLAGRNLTQGEWDRYLPNSGYRATCPEWPEGE